MSHKLRDARPPYEDVHNYQTVTSRRDRTAEGQNKSPETCLLLSGTTKFPKYRDIFSVPQMLAKWKGKKAVYMQPGCSGDCAKKGTLTGAVY